MFLPQKKVNASTKAINCVQVSGGESYTIGLRFASSQSPGSVKIHVYVNNLEEKTEETFVVNVDYSWTFPRTEMCCNFYTQFQSI